MICKSSGSDEPFIPEPTYNSYNIHHFFFFVKNFFQLEPLLNQKNHFFSGSLQKRQFQKFLNFFCNCSSGRLHFVCNAIILSL